MPKLIEKEKYWDFVIKVVFGFIEDILVISDLIYKTKYHLSSQLNAIIKTQAFNKVNHIMEVLYWV